MSVSRTHCANAFVEEQARMIRISRNGVIVWSARPHSKDGMVEHNDEHSKKTQQDHDQLAG